MTDAYNRKVFLTCGLIFFTVFISLYVLYQFLLPYIEHYFNWLAASVSQVAGLFDDKFSYRENLIFYGEKAAVRVIEGCDGVTVFILTAAAVASFPKTLRERLLGLLILLPVLFAINWLRLLVLVWIRVYVPDLFGFIHVYLFQPVMIFATFACFIAWILYDRKDRYAH